MLESRSAGHGDNSFPALRFRAAAFGFVALLWALAGCTLVPQVDNTIKVSNLGLAPGDLERGGLAFITPSTVTTQEEDKQNVAFVFASVLKREHPNIRCVTLPEALGEINRAGLADEYRQIYRDHRDTGMFEREVLRKVGQATGVRYLAQIKLAGLTQGSEDRLGVLGFRVAETKRATVRLFLQIWDSEHGTIVWEGLEELSYAYDTVGENPVTFQKAVEAAAQDLLAKIPALPKDAKPQPT
jgi:hypothetical protein